MEFSKCKLSGSSERASRGAANTAAECRGYRQTPRVTLCVRCSRLTLLRRARGFAAIFFPFALIGHAPAGKSSWEQGEERRFESLDKPGLIEEGG
jgi:hypothetical protein